MIKEKNNGKEDFQIKDLAKLLIWAFKGERKNQEVVGELKNLGFSSSQISSLLGIPNNHVQTYLVRLKNKKNGKN